MPLTGPISCNASQEVSRFLHKDNQLQKKTIQSSRISFPQPVLVAIRYSGSSRYTPRPPWPTGAHGTPRETQHTKREGVRRRKVLRGGDDMRIRHSYLHRLQLHVPGASCPVCQLCLEVHTVSPCKWAPSSSMMDITKWYLIRGKVYKKSHPKRPSTWFLIPVHICPTKVRYKHLWMSLGTNQQGPNTLAQCFILWIAFWDGPIFRGYVRFGGCKVRVFCKFFGVENRLKPSPHRTVEQHSSPTDKTVKRQQVFYHPKKNGWVPQLGVYWTTDVVAHDDNVLPTGIIRLIEVKTSHNG